MDDKLDKYFRPVDSPIAQNKGQVSSFNFYSQNETNAVSTKKIKNFSFSSGRGGTLTLGDIDNGNGVLSIKNDTGDEIVRGDKNGLTINDGSLSLFDSTGAIIIDNFGINSLNSFNFDQVESTTQQTSSSSSYTDVSGSSLASFTITRQTNCLIYFTFVGLTSALNIGGTEEYLQVQFVDDVTELENGHITGITQSVTTVDFGAPSYSIIADSEDATVSYTKFVTLSVGTHSFKLRFRRENDSNGGATTVSLNKWLLGYVLFGS